MTWDWNTPVEQIREELNEMVEKLVEDDISAAFTSAELENLLQVTDTILIGLQRIKMVVSSALKKQQEV